MEIVALQNLRSGMRIGELWLADRFMDRLRGLIGRPVLKAGEGLWLKPCRQVHMFGMRYPLSIWFLDSEGRILRLIDCLKPGEVSPLCREAVSILEFPAQWGKTTGTEVGDRLSEVNIDLTFNSRN